MKEYIFTSRDDIYIIDLQKTVKKIEEAYAAMKTYAENGAQVLFVGTKKQAQEAVEECATRTNMFFINERWLGGTLTNFKTIKTRIRRLDEIEKMEADGTFDLLPKKEVIGIKKEYDKLNKNLRGIRNMKKTPDVMVVVDPKNEEIAIKEARILGIPVFGVVDTNCDPDMVDFVIPGNDDAVRSVKLLIGSVTNAIAEVNGNEIMECISEEDKNGKKEHKKETPKVEVKAEVKEEVKETPKAKTEAKEEIKKETPKKEKEEVKEETKDFSELTLTELKEKAKEAGIKGYSKMKKEELITALN